VLEFIQNMAALQAIFEMGFIPRPDNLEELSIDDYIAVSNGMGMDLDPKEKWFKINPPGRYWEAGIYTEAELPAPVRDHELPILNEQQCQYLWTAVAFIDRCCANCQPELSTDLEKLRHLAKRVPDVVCKGFYERYGAD
jgi:hypothetical protein